MQKKKEEEEEEKERERNFSKRISAAYAVLGLLVLLHGGAERSTELAVHSVVDRVHALELLQLRNHLRLLVRGQATLDRYASERNKA
jgi:hypothetical protein